jgi:hypothetical protein
MTGRDQYSYAVKCPKCGAQGTVEISEATTDSLKPRGAMERLFDTIPEPFAAVSIQPIRFRCKTCDVETC